MFGFKYYEDPIFKMIQLKQLLNPNELFGGRLAG